MKQGLVYFHGFASGPSSVKAAYLSKALDLPLIIADLEGGAFKHLLIDEMMSRGQAALTQAAEQFDRWILVGSSLGGYIAASLMAQQQLRQALTPGLVGLCLIAPAFNFLPQWDAQLGAPALAAWQSRGVLPFYHYGQEREVDLHYAFYQSCSSHPLMPGPSGLPTRIIHGKQDAVVAWQGSAEYNEQCPGGVLDLCESDHSLGSPDDLTRLAQHCRTLLAGADA